MVLHNPNNWHWVNKDATGWAREYLDKNLLGISAEENNVSAKISKVVSMEGDVDVSQRKGKVITLFDVQVKLEYEGESACACCVLLYIRCVFCSRIGFFLFLFSLLWELSDCSANCVFRLWCRLGW